MTDTFVNFGNSFNSIRVLLGGMIKNEQIQFFDSQMYCNNLNTITLKLFHNHGGIYRFRKKFKKDSGENCEGLGW